jgi:light-regulated signal transduction histidine kinase (bacteriophytochrome)
MEKLRKLKTGSRLFVGFTFIVLAMFIAVAFCLNTSETVYDAFEELQSVITPGIVTMSDMAKLAAIEQAVQNAHDHGFRYGLQIFVFAVFLAVGIILAEIRSIIKAHKALRKSSEIIGRSNLDHRLGTDSKDETGQLSHITDQTATHIKETNSSVDLQNITKQQKQVSEQQLEAINQQLYEEIAQRKRVEEALEVSNREFKDFIHIVSHDLREPLRKISSFGTLLKDSLDGKLDKENIENLGFMIDGAERMNQMIEDLLAYSRINTKAISLGIVDLNEVVEQLVQLDLAALLEENGTIIEIPEPLPKVHVDPVLLRQLLQNLIVNGIKNCRDNRDNLQPRILIRAERSAENKVRIELQDNGASIDKQHQHDIFKMSINLNSKQEREGIGTGLAVCKKIVDKHGGQIGVESKLGVGSTFWFILPESKSIEQDKPVLYVRT